MCVCPCRVRILIFSQMLYLISVSKSVSESAFACMHARLLV